MRRIIIIALMCVCAGSVQAQTNPFPNTDSLIRYINRWIRNSPVEAFQNLRMNTVLIGIVRFIGSAEGGGNGVDTMYAINDSTLRLVTDLGTFTATIRGAKDVDSIYRKPGQDSIFYKISGIERAIKDSAGTNFILYNALGGTGDSLVNADKEVKWLAAGDGILHAVTGTTITHRVDSSKYATQYDLTQISGTTNLDTTRTATTVTVTNSTGTDAVILGADTSLAGLVTTGEQRWKGNKRFDGKTTNFYGFAPRIGSNWLPATKLADSLYQANEYLAFGFMTFLAGGTYVHVYAQADNHVGNNSRIKMRRSHDGGRVWDGPTTIDTATGSTLVSGIGGGVSRKNTIIVFDNTFTLSGSDQTMTGQRVLRSEDGGETFSAPITIPFNSETVFQPYGPLVNGANGDMFLTWYGFTGSTYSSYIIKSTDDGKTWGSPVAIVSNTTSQRTETSVAWLGGEDYVALARSEVNDTLYGQFISHDGCATWSYQGQVSFGIKGTPAWLSRIKTQNGRLAIEACYRDGTLGGGFFVNAIYGYADSILLGPSGWDLNTEVKVFDSLDGSGYVSVAHPYDEMYGLATVFDETLAQADATLKFFSQPKGNNFPIGVSTGISGLTTNRIIVATGASSIGDFANFKVNNTSSSIIVGGVAGNTWSAHNGGVIDGGKSSLLLSNDGFPALLNNAYLDGTYKYASTGFASAVVLDAGQLYLLNAASGTVGTDITWNTRLRIGTAGDFIVNGSAGSVDQVLVSAGSGAAATWQTFLSSQWMTVTTDDINYSGDNVGIHTAVPLSPLHITDNLSATTDRSIRIMSNNSNVGGSIFLSCNACPTGDRAWSMISDGNGFNIAKDGNTPSATPSTKFLVNHNGEAQIGSLTDQGAYTLQNTGGLYHNGAGSIHGIHSANPGFKFFTHDTDSSWSQITMAQLRDSIGSSTTIYSGDGSLAGNRTITGAGNTLTMTGTQSSSYAFNVTNTGNGGAGSFATNGTGSALTGANSSSGNGILGTSSSGNGLSATSATGLAGRFKITPSSTNSVASVLDIIRGSSGTTDVGAGARVNFKITDNGGNDATAATIQAVFTDASAGEISSEFQFNTTNGGSSTTKFTVKQTGQTRAHSYGIGTFTGTPAYTILADASGNHIEQVAPKIYNALITQSGTAAPSATVLGTNSIGAIVWTRSSAGIYVATLTSAFPASKVLLLTGFSDESAGGNILYRLKRTGDNTLELWSSPDGINPGDVFTNLSIKIEVYP